MSFHDLVSPLRRHKWTFVLSVLLLSFLGYAGVNKIIPDVQKTTLYFSVKPASNATNTESLTLDPLESSMKVAEMISGWAKDPSFRKMILIKSKATIDKFKKKISAKKQNRANVFWTLSLTKSEQIQQQKLVEGIRQSIQQRLETFNEGNQYPYAITPIEEAVEYRVIPPSWKFSACVILSLILAYILIFIFEMVRGKVSFPHQIRQIFPEAPLFILSANDGDASWEHFKQKVRVREIIATAAPQKRGTLLEEFFVSTSGDTTILLVCLGKTSLVDLENLAAAYHQEPVAIILEN